MGFVAHIVVLMYGLRKFFLDEVRSGQIVGFLVGWVLWHINLDVNRFDGLINTAQSADAVEHTTASL